MHDPPETRKKRWKLGDDAFERLLTWLHEDRDQAGEEYEKVRTRLQRYFEWRNAPCPEDLCDETLDVVARKLQEGKDIEGNKLAYIYTVAHYVLMAARRRYQREILVEPNDLARVKDEAAPRPDGPESDPRLAVLRECLKMLRRGDSDLIVGYYAGEKLKDQRKALRELLQLTDKVLKVRASRLRSKLENCMREISASLKKR